MKVIVINGSNQTGKDKFVSFIKEYHSDTVYNISTVDKVKKICKKHCGWNGKKTDDARKFLSEFKRIWTEFNNGPFNDVCGKIQKKYLENDMNDVVLFFIHCREPKEIQKFKDYYKEDFISVLIRKEGAPSIANNDSDMNVGNYEYDYTYDCPDDQILEEKAKEFLKLII
jgi:hypothetical protein